MLQSWRYSLGLTCNLGASGPQLCTTMCFTVSRTLRGFGASNSLFQVCALRAAVPFEVSLCRSWCSFHRGAVVSKFSLQCVSSPPPAPTFPVSMRFSWLWSNYAGHKIFLYYKWCARNNMSFVSVIFLLQIISWFDVLALNQPDDFYVNIRSADGCPGISTGLSLAVREQSEHRWWVHSVRVPATPDLLYLFTSLDALFGFFFSFDFHKIMRSD